MGRSQRPLLLSSRLVASLAALTLAACGTIPYPPPTPLLTDARRLPTGATEVSVGVSPFYDFTPNWLGGWAQGGFSWAFSERLQLGLRVGVAGEGPTYGAQLAGPVSEGKGWTLDWLGGLGGTISSGGRSDCPVPYEDGTWTCPVEEARGTLRYLTFAPYAGIRGSRALSERWALGGLIRASYARTFITEGVGDIRNTDAWWLEAMFGVVFAPIPELRVGLGLMTYQFIDDLALPMVAATGSLTWSFGGDP